MIPSRDDVRRSTSARHGMPSLGEQKKKDLVESGRPRRLVVTGAELLPVVVIASWSEAPAIEDLQSLPNAGELTSAMRYSGVSLKHRMRQARHLLFALLP